MVVRRMTRLLKLLVVCWAVGRSVGSGPVSDCCWADEWMDAVLPNSPQPILSPIYYCLVCFSVAWQKRMRKKRKAKQEKKKRFFFHFKESRPARSISSSIRFYLYISLVFSTNALLAHGYMPRRHTHALQAHVPILVCKEWSSHT